MDFENEEELEMEDELDNIIVLNDENGEEVKFEFLDLIEFEDEEYVVLLPLEEEEDAGEVVILKVEDTDSEEEESYVSVDDQDVLQKVFEIFKDKFKDEFNFISHRKNFYNYLFILICFHSCMFQVYKLQLVCP